MFVEFLGHAGVLLRFGNTALVMDGWFSREGAFDASWYQLPCNHHLGERDWSDIDAAIVSHEHLDHFDSEFLGSLPDTIPVLIPSYPSSYLPKLVEATVGRRPTILEPGKEHAFGDIRFRIWAESSPMNHDTVWAFKAPSGTVLHTVDARLALDQFDEILAYLGGPPDLAMFQGAGASWYPMVYEQYDEATRKSLSHRKREQKLTYVQSAANRLRPRVLAMNAGPAAFLDPEIYRFNKDPSFVSPMQALRWLQDQGYPGKIVAPMPGDTIEVATAQAAEDERIRQEFSWDQVAPYLTRYAAKMQPIIERVRNRADAIEAEDLFGGFSKHFERMLGLERYFLDRIGMTVCFEIEGEGGGKWLVDFRNPPDVRPYRRGDSYQYRYRFHSRWLKRVLVDDVRWENFMLGLRFSAWRDPDRYNDHLLGVMKFNDKPSLRAVKRFEKKISDETIIVSTADGARYEIAKYCPHAGANLEAALIEGHLITCLNHHYTFDLDSGNCLSGNCVLRSKRLK